ncbi:hypothetical protein MKX03_018021 [Papaver bracteatum]|nr:hypothetical protein MKX03_018021 [Papaver bracteatum]
MSHLLTDLSSGVMHPSVTPLIFSCFGDIGIAIGKYLPYVIPMIQVASEICAEMDTANEAMMNYKKTREESVSKAAVAAMGDPAHALGPNVKILFKDRAFYVDFLLECLDSDHYKMKEIATWTQRMINQGLILKEGNCW